MANSTNNLNLFTPDLNSPLVYKNISFFGELSQANLPEQLPNFGVVYALELDNGLVKIGCTSQPAKRIQNLKKTMSMYGNTYVTRVALSEACTNYKTLEAELHKFFKKSRVDGELFQVDILDVINTVGQMYLISQQSQVLSTDVVTEWIFELMTKGQVSLKGKVPLTRAEIKSIIEAKVRDTVSNALAKPKLETVTVSNDDWFALIENYLKGKDKCTITLVLTSALKMDLKRCNKMSRNRVADVLRGLGWKQSSNIIINGKRKRGWKRPL